jgi:hypothetical protein
MVHRRNVIEEYLLEKPADAGFFSTSAIVEPMTAHS